MRLDPWRLNPNGRRSRTEHSNRGRRSVAFVKGHGFSRAVKPAPSADAAEGRQSAQLLDENIPVAPLRVAPFIIPRYGTARSRVLPKPFSRSLSGRAFSNSRALRHGW